MDRRKLQDVVARNKHFTPTRKVSLFSSFARLEETNPDGFEANVAAWKEVLEDAVVEGAFGDATCIEVNPELLANLTDPENGAPLSLQSVIEHMVQDGTIMPLADFQAAFPSSPSTNTSSLAVRALSWAVGFVYTGSKSYRGDGSREEKFVHMRVLRDKSCQLVDKLTKNADAQGGNYISKVFNVSQVQEIASSEFSSLDIESCLALANSERRIAFDKDSNVVKLVSAGSITDTDATISSLRDQISSLAQREAALEEQVAEYDRKARSAIKDNRKAAKRMLQKKLDAQKSHERTVTALDQLDTVLQKIDDAKDNKQAFEALKSSSAVLAGLNESLSIEDVDELVERLQETVADTDEVTKNLADLSVSQSSADREMEELELDDELKRLSEAETAKSVGNKLPSVPKHKPVADPNASEPSERNKAKSPEARKAHAA